jgi:SAM-dependent methyltransferase
MSEPLYGQLAAAYARNRRTDPHIAASLWRALGDASSVLNVGAGTGSYEPADRDVVAVEPSGDMRARRPSQSAPCVDARAEHLPFPDSSFDVVMSVFSHWHWRSEDLGFAEMHRVARQRVLVVTMDRSVADRFWLTREYLVNAHDLWGSIGRVIDLVRPSEIIKIPIPGDCADGFFHAFWRRPRAFLDSSVRESMAVFARLDEREVRRGLARLEADLDSGAWHRAHADLLGMPSLDLGCRLLIHQCEGGAAE